MAVRCANCVWLDGQKCLIFDIRIYAPNIPRRCSYYNVVPELAKNYLEKVSEFAELDPKEVKNSYTFKRYLSKFKLTKL